MRSDNIPSVYSNTCLKDDLRICTCASNLLSVSVTQKLLCSCRYVCLCASACVPLYEKQTKDILSYCLLLSPAVSPPQLFSTPRCRTNSGSRTYCSKTCKAARTRRKLPLNAFAPAHRVCHDLYARQIATERRRKQDEL